MTWIENLARDAEALLCCPRCSQTKFSIRDGELACDACQTRYPFDSEKGVCSLLGKDSNSAIKDDIRKWWGDLYAQLYAATDKTLTANNLPAMLKDLEDMFYCRENLAAGEMPLAALAGKKVLEIGPGGGGHSALFQSKGADMRAVDITPERAISTAFKFSLLPGNGMAYQADAEHLPFRDNSFDIVYSNGVLHHSENTDRCIAEVRRVLKPGGRAVVMLYARHSAVFWLNILPRGLFSGEFFRWPEAQWIGRVTEGKPKHGSTRNPITRVYTKAGMERLFSDFRIHSLRQSSFQFDNVAIPRMTQIRNRILKLLGYKPHPGGMLVYGAPFMCETPLELALGRHMGFAWNIVAEKP